MLATGLYTSMLLWTSVFNVFGGPWNNGHFHWFLKGFSDTCTAGVYLPITQLLYEDIFRESKFDGPEVGSDDHLCSVHARVPECPLIRNKGEKATPVSTRFGGRGRPWVAMWGCQIEVIRHPGRPVGATLPMHPASRDSQYALRNWRVSRQSSLWFGLTWLVAQPLPPSVSAGSVEIANLCQ